MSTTAVVSLQWTVGDWPVAKSPPPTLQPVHDGPQSSLEAPSELPGRRHPFFATPDDVKPDVQMAGPSEHRKPCLEEDPNKQVLQYDGQARRLGDEPANARESVKQREMDTSSPVARKRLLTPTQRAPSPRHVHTPPRPQYSPVERTGESSRQKSKNVPSELSLKSSQRSDLSSPVRDSPNHDSLIFRGSPVSLKTPEIRLSKLDSPVRTQAPSTSGAEVARQLSLTSSEQETPFGKKGTNIFAPVREQEPPPMAITKEPRGSPMDVSGRVQPTAPVPTIPHARTSTFQPSHQESPLKLHPSVPLKPHPSTPPPPYINSSGMDLSPYHHRAVPGMSYSPQTMLNTSPRQERSPHVQHPQDHQHQFSPRDLVGHLQPEQLGSPLQQSSPPPPGPQTHLMPGPTSSYPAHVPQTPQFPGTDQQTLLQQQLYSKQQQLQRQQMQQHHHQQQLQQLQHQQQLVAQQQMLAQRQQQMLQHYGPQKLQHSGGPLRLTEQQQPQVLSQSQSAFQQQQHMLLAQQRAAAQQQYLYQQAVMRNQMAGPRPLGGMSQYYLNPTASMGQGDSGSLPSSKPAPQPQPKLMHISSLQRLSQEPNRSPLGLAPQGQPLVSQMPTLTRLGSPYARGGLQMTQPGLGEGAGIAGSPSLGPGPLSHFNPHAGGR